MGSAAENAIDRALSRGEVGLQVAAYHRGELVIDISAGKASENGREVDSGTVFWVASAGKVSTATALHVQVERGLLDYDQTIASIWPEFGTRGKESLTVRDALTHRAGLPDLPGDATPELLGDWEWMVERLARSTPSDDPARRNTYHARTWGYVVGEIARRADPMGRSFEDLVREHVHAPLGITEIWHRLPESVQAGAAVVKGEILGGEFTVTADHEINTAEYRDRIDPSGAWVTAREAARLWALYAQAGELDGRRLLPADRIETFLAPRACAFPAGAIAGPRAVIGMGGLMVGGAVTACDEVLGFRSNRVLWHPGAGGALGFADLDAELAVMICHNEFFDERPHPQHPFASLVRAVYTDIAG
ncbi:serine hydrolase domain-containing protein [Nocardia carnea]|uniref:serine hydrolase domain-containing protein n=1 Tax=Nocardia carnea TaxID=37328 RepID=UPI002455C13A|nr:serine hydrolase domain-containing protein [Nocardia carnea]